MRWSLRILSGLTIMTAPYIWTVGQTGLESANRNLCDLLSTASPWPLPSCKFHMTYLGLWVIGILVAIAFAMFDTTRYVKKIAAPHGGIIHLTRRCCSQAGDRAKDSWAKVEPSHVIILGLMIASGGAAWLLYQGGAPDGPLLKKLKIAEQNVQILEAQAKSHASAEALMSLARPHLSSIDYDERRRILNTFYKHVNGPIRDTYGLAWGLYNDQPRLINANQKGVYEELVKIRQQLISEWQDLVAPLVRDAELYADIRNLNWNFHSTTLLPTLNELINVLRIPVESGNSVFVDSKETDKLKTGIQALGQWIEDTKDGIQKLRAKDDDAQVYRSEAKP